jgi:hypothetical protein
VRALGVNCNVDFLGAGTIQAGKDLLTGSSTTNPNFAGSVVFGLGLGNYIAFNNATGKYEFYVGNAKVFSIP